MNAPIKKLKTYNADDIAARNAAAVDAPKAMSIEDRKALFYGKHLVHKEVSA